MQLNIGVKLGKDSVGGLNDGDKLVSENTIPSTEVSSEIQVNSKVDFVYISSDHNLYPQGITKTANLSSVLLQSVPASSVKEEAKEIARNVLSKSASRNYQQVKSINMEKGDESDLQTNTSNVVVDEAEDISDWASSEAVVKAENSKRFRNCGRSEVISTSWNPSIKEKALAIARNVLAKKPAHENHQKKMRNKLPPIIFP